MINWLTINSVNYTIPKSAHIHKSMLLRGVKFATPMLNSADVRAVKGRAQNSGRSFGGAPFRGGGRGGRMDYGGNRGGGDQGPGRPNPFAAHLDPRFMPGPQGNMPMMPPGWVPPGPGSGDYSRGPPPAPRGGMSNQYPPHQGYQQDQYGHRGGYGSHDNRGRGGYRGGRYRGQNRGGGHGHY